MQVFDDVVAEQDRLEAVLSGLSQKDWLTESGAPGWTIADVVLHLAQTEEAVVVTASAGDRGLADHLASHGGDSGGDGIDEAMARMVSRERAEPAVIFDRWRTARRGSIEALRRADPHQPLVWAAASLKPRTLATTRLAEHWAHGLDIAAPLGIDYPDTARLRHVAWLGHSTLPYAFAVAGAPPQPVFCELTGPDGEIWPFGPADAESTVRGSAGAFCRVGARRLAAEESGLVTTGPHGQAALRVLRNYAV